MKQLIPQNGVELVKDVTNGTDFFSSPYKTYENGNPAMQVMLQQKFDVKYSGAVGNSYQENTWGESVKLAGNGEYGTTRNAWEIVPEGTTWEQAVAHYAKFKNSCIWQIVSYNVEDILTEEQKAALDSGKTTLDAYRESMVVKNAKGEIVKDRANNLPMYTQEFFSTTQKSDIDLRRIESVDSSQLSGVKEEAAPNVSGQ